MILLIGSIVLTSYLILVFKVLERFRIPVLQSIVANHMVCVVTGSLVNREVPFQPALFHEPWLVWSGIMGVMFVVLFNIIAFTAQKIGVAVASVSNKLSLVIPFVFSLYLFNEKATALKITGIVLALAAVLLTTWPAKKEKIKQETTSPFLLVVLPLILFLGSGLLDTLIKYVEQHFINDGNQDIYLTTTFASASLFGLLTLIALFALRKQTFDFRSIIAGIAIGIPNYFSIWCLLKVLKQFEGNSSAIIPINNMGIVLFSSVMAWLLFRERLSALNWTGIVLSLGAIALIAFG